jgi:glucosyl-dolichyl phosphate glucuronosyltransferase
MSKIITNIDIDNKNGLSIIICASQRKSFLLNVVAQLLLQQCKSFQTEIIIVYKGFDGKFIHKELKKLFKHNRGGNFSLKFLLQTSIGTSRARNIGIINSSYPILVFIDDDTIPLGENWTEKIYEIFKNKKIVAACGKITLYKPLENKFNLFKPYYTFWQEGTKAKYLQLGATPPSAQLILRKEILMKIGGFRGNFGRSVKSLLSGEDDELTSYLGILGIKIWYDPNLIVRHKIPRERITQTYLLHRVFWQGPTDAIIRQYIPGFYNKSLKNVLIQIADHFLRYCSQTLKKGHYKEFHKFNFHVYTAMFIGEIYGRFYANLFIKAQPRPINIFQNL